MEDIKAIATFISAIVINLAVIMVLYVVVQALV